MKQLHVYVGRDVYLCIQSPAHIIFLILLNQPFSSSHLPQISVAFLLHSPYPFITGCAKPSIKKGDRHMEFSKITSQVMSVIYKKYLENIKSGKSIADSRYLQSDFYTDSPKLSSYSESDISKFLQELKEAGFIKLNILGEIEIQPTFIIKMENRFKNGLVEVTKYIGELVAGTVSGLIL